jgi:hypothetical protein
MNDYQKKEWKQINEHFACTDKSVKPSGPAFKGLALPVNLKTAKYILNNLESFKKAVMELEHQSRQVEVENIERKMVAEFVKLGLTPEKAIIAAKESLANAGTR